MMFRLLIILSVLLLAACGSPAQPDATSLQATVEAQVRATLAAQQAAIPTATATTAPTNTPEPTHTPRPTSTPGPTKTPIPPTPTATPSRQPSDQQAEREYLALVADYIREFSDSIDEILELANNPQPNNPTWTDELGTLAGNTTLSISWFEQQPSPESLNELQQQTLDALLTCESWLLNLDGGYYLKDAQRLAEAEKLQPLCLTKLQDVASTTEMRLDDISQ